MNIPLRCVGLNSHNLTKHCCHLTGKNKITSPFPNPKIQLFFSAWYFESMAAVLAFWLRCQGTWRMLAECAGRAE